MGISIIREIFDELHIEDYESKLQAVFYGDSDRDTLVGTAFKAGAVAILAMLEELKGPEIVAELEEFIEFIVNEEE